MTKAYTYDYGIIDDYLFAAVERKVRERLELREDALAAWFAGDPEGCAPEAARAIYGWVEAREGAEADAIYEDADDTFGGRTALLERIAA